MEYKGAKGSSKDVIIILSFVTGLIIILYMLAKREAGALAEDFTNKVAGAVPKIPGWNDLFPPEPSHPPVTAVTQSMNPGDFPTELSSWIENGKEVKGETSQPFVDYMAGWMKRTDTNAVILTPEQEANFKDPYGDYLYEQHIKEVLAAKKDEKLQIPFTDIEIGGWW